MESGILGLKLLVLALALVLAALASAAQASLFYVNRARVRSLIAEGFAPADAVIKTIDEPAGGLSTAIALSVLGVFIGAVAGIWLGADTGLSPGIAQAVTGGLALVLLLLAQIMGRAAVAAAPEQAAPRLVPPLRLISALLTPIVRPMVWLEGLLLRSVGLKPKTLLTEEEAMLVAESPPGNGVLEQDERAMIHGIIGMSQRPVREVMSPRPDVVAVSDASTVSDVLDEVVRTGHSRIPLYETSIDNVVGVAYAKDLLRHLKTGSLEDAVAPLARPAYFVPESKKVDELLQEMQRQGVHVAIVVDEYGGTAGLVSIEDLLEEIVGEIRDEYDTEEEEPVVPLGEGEAMVNGRVSIRDLNDALGLHLDQDEIDTLGGLIYHRLGKMPMVGDQVHVDGCDLTVVETAGRRVRKVRVVRTPETDDDPDSRS